MDKQIKFICEAWLWTYKHPETGEWIEDNRRYMATGEAEEYFQGINTEFKMLPYKPKFISVPYEDGLFKWNKSTEIIDKDRPLCAVLDELKELY